jgi:hypothetical protein
VDCIFCIKKFQNGCVHHRWIHTSIHKDLWRIHGRSIRTSPLPAMHMRIQYIRFVLYWCISLPSPFLDFWRGNTFFFERASQHSLKSHLRYPPEEGKKWLNLHFLSGNLGLLMFNCADKFTIRRGCPRREEPFCVTYCTTSC